MSARRTPGGRDGYRRFETITTRWMDNDAFGHVNNVQYYSFIDTTVCTFLIESGLLHPTQSAVIAVAVESGCTYFSSLAYPDQVTGGLRVERLGRSSVRYGVGIFRNDEETESAAGHFVHVYVDRETRRPVPVPEALVGVLEPLKV